MIKKTGICVLLAVFIFSAFLIPQNNLLALELPKISIISIIQLIREFPQHLLFAPTKIVYRPLKFKHSDGRVLKLAVWSPRPLATFFPFLRFVKRPLVVFSHGASACPYFLPDVILYLVKEKGYMVAVPDHPDLVKSCSMNEIGTINFSQLMQSMQMFTSPAGALPADAQDQSINETLEEVCGKDAGNGLCSERIRDVKLVIDKLTSLDKINNPLITGVAKIDLNKIAVIGHSLGGWTALGVSGAHPQYKDSRIKAVISLDAGSYVFNREDISNITIPLMVVSSDDAGLPQEILPYRFYEWAKQPKYFLKMKDFSHIDFVSLPCCMGSIMPMESDTCDNIDQKVAVINSYVGAFLDLYLKGSSSAASLLHSHAPNNFIEYYDYQ